MKFRVITADPPWGFSDPLTMSDVKRGAEANYSILTIDKIKEIPVQDVAEDDSVLCLWVPSSLLQEGLDVMKAWGFRQTQTWVWVKVKKNPFENKIKTLLKTVPTCDLILDNILWEIKKFYISLNLHDILNFGMGRMFRQTHEICLVGVRGKIYNFLKDKSQRSVCFDVNLKHSKKTEILQNRLEIMFPNNNYLEIFGRRKKDKWVVLGNEIDGKDIFDSIKELRGNDV